MTAVNSMADRGFPSTTSTAPAPLNWCKILTGTACRQPMFATVLSQKRSTTPTSTNPAGGLRCHRHLGDINGLATNVRVETGRLRRARTTDKGKINGEPINVLWPQRHSICSPVHHHVNATSSALPAPARAIAEQRVRRARGDAQRPAGRGPHRRRPAQRHGGRSRQRRRGYGYAVRGIVSAGPRRAVRPHRQTRHDCSANEQIVCEADARAKAPVTAGVHPLGISCDEPDIPVFAVSMSADAHSIRMRCGRPRVGPTPRITPIPRVGDGA